MTKPATSSATTTAKTAKPAGRRRIAGDRTRRPADLPDDDTRTTVIDPTEPVTEAEAEAEAETETQAETQAAPAVESEAAPAVESEAEAGTDGGAAESGRAAAAASIRFPPRTITAILAACLVAVLAACALAGLTTRSDRADVAAGNEALAAARASATRILSYDYRHLDADFAQATALTTGAFRGQYQQTTAKAVRDLATQTQAVVTASVAAGGVVSSSQDGATVLLFVNQTTTSNRLDAAKVDLNRVQLTLTRTDGRWLVSALSAL